MKNQTKSSEHLPPTPPSFLFPRISFIFGCLPPPCRREQGTEAVVSTTLSSLWGGLDPCVAVWDLSRGRQSSMGSSNVCSSLDLQFSTNCSSMSAFHEVQSFREEPFQCGSPTRSQICQQTCFRVDSFPRVLDMSLFQHECPVGSQLPLGSACSGMGSSMGCGWISAPPWTSGCGWISATCSTSSP